MVEFLQNLSNSDIFVTLMGVLTANLGTIIGVIIYAVRQGLKRAASKEEFQAECAQYVEEAKTTCLDVLTKVEKIVKDLEFKVVDKVDTTEAAKKAEIEAQKIELTKTINETKAALTLDEIIEEEV